MPADADYGKDPISPDVGQTVPLAIREIVKAVAELEADVLDGGVTVATLAEKTGLEKASVSLLAKDAIKRGYLKNLEGKSGRPARLVAGGPLPDEVNDDSVKTEPPTKIETPKFELKAERIGAVEKPRDIPWDMFFVFAVAIIIVGVVGYFLFYISTRPFGQNQQTDLSDFTRLNIATSQFDTAQIQKLSPILRNYTADYCDSRSKYKLIGQVHEAGFVRLAANLSAEHYEKCAKDGYFLAMAATYHRELGEPSQALEIINRVIELDPANPNFRYSRGRIYEALGLFEKALLDQISALDLLGKPETVGPNQFYEIATMYAALGRFCEAATPLETYISLNFATHKTPQIERVIDEYRAKGNCKQQPASNSASVRLRNAGGVFLIEATLNKVPGLFILDTGASIVVIKKSFADKAKIPMNVENQIISQTANGLTRSILSTAELIQVGNATSTFVPVAISDDAKLGDEKNVVGLLGMSFLARFKVTVENNSVELVGRF